MIEYGPKIGPGGDGAIWIRRGGTYIAGPFADEKDALVLIRTRWPHHPYVRTVFAIPADGRELPPELSDLHGEAMVALEAAGVGTEAARSALADVISAM